MLTREENDLLTRVGPQTPIGERLVAFRDTEGRIGLLDERCPHRTVSLYFGRNEERGLRCVYHGWKFDVAGNCVDMPSEPPGGGFRHKVRTTAYPCVERGGVIWTYMGPPEQRPEFPDLEWTRVPASHRYASRHIQECNWLQGLEGGFDSSHLAFLHKGSVEGGPRIIPSRYEVVPTDFGFVVGTGREVSETETEWFANVMLAPFHKLIATVPHGAHVWVPMDDEHTMLYSIDYMPNRPLTEAEVRQFADGLHTHTENLPGSDRAVRNKNNDYLIDRELQRSGRSFTGMKGLGIQDCALQESMGPIADRTREHLGASDTAIIKIRRLLATAVRDLAAGTTPPGLAAASYRVRSARFRMAKEKSFADVFSDYVRTDARAYAGNLVP
jgi:phenylpropionate dioxygenase-like ring-hydroxylating dioxygenase large terminal subunit